MIQDAWIDDATSSSCSDGSKGPRVAGKSSSTVESGESFTQTSSERNSDFSSYGVSPGGKLSAAASSDSDEALAVKHKNMKEQAIDEETTIE